MLLVFPRVRVRVRRPTRPMRIKFEATDTGYIQCARVGTPEEGDQPRPAFDTTDAEEASMSYRWTDGKNNPSGLRACPADYKYIPSGNAEGDRCIKDATDWTCPTGCVENQGRGDPYCE